MNDALEESLKVDEESQTLFLIAFRNIAEAQGCGVALAKKLMLVVKASIKNF